MSRLTMVRKAGAGFLAITALATGAISMANPASAAVSPRTPEVQLGTNWNGTISRPTSLSPGQIAQVRAQIYGTGDLVRRVVYWGYVQRGGACDTGNTSSRIEAVNVRSRDDLFLPIPIEANATDGDSTVGRYLCLRQDVWATSNGQPTKSGTVRIPIVAAATTPAPSATPAPSQTPLPSPTPAPVPTTSTGPSQVTANTGVIVSRPRTNPDAITVGQSFNLIYPISSLDASALSAVTSRLGIHGLADSRGGKCRNTTTQFLDPSNNDGYSLRFAASARGKWLCAYQIASTAGGAQQYTSPMLYKRLS